jgi:predicted DNA-binding antitoxin AbrB/MazE fold protein
MSIKATYVDGVFKPIEQVTDAVPGKTYRVFSEEELRVLTEDLQWLKAAEKSFEFWDNEEDAVYDNL